MPMLAAKLGKRKGSLELPSGKAGAGGEKHSDELLESLQLRNSDASCDKHRVSC